MITISVESDEEQWAIGTALVNGALSFGNWPFQVRRTHGLGPGGSGGSGSRTLACGGANATAGSAGGGNGGGAGSVSSVTVSGSAGAAGGCAGGGGGSGGTSADYRWTFGSPLRSCCATMPFRDHLDGCDER